MKKLLKRVLGITASVSLLVTSSLTAWADGHSHRADDKPITTPSGDYTITLTTPPGYPEIDSKNCDKFEYGAYQIFKGTVKGNNYNDIAPSAEYPINPGTEGKAIPITDIKWGNAFGVEGEEGATEATIHQNILGFVYALSQAKSGSYNYAFGDFDGFDTGFFSTDSSDTITLDSAYVKDGTTEVTIKVEDGKVTNITNDNQVNYDKLAVAVADVLVDHPDHEWLQAFNDILGGFGQGTGGTYKNPGYISRYYAGSWETSNYKNYKIENVPAGYYMILDRTDVEVEDAAYSARMLFVVNNVTQVLKEGVPKLDKNVVRTDGKLYETEAAGVGDEVKFRLTGTLPSNYDLFLGGYQYKFTDTLSKGLTLKENSDSSGGKYYVTVKVKNVYNSTTGELVTDDDGKEYTITTKSCKKDGTHTKHEEIEEAYTEVYNTTDGKNELTVTFPCLKEIVITDADGKTYTLGEKSVIYIDYTAVVNENAIVSPADGNKNKAVLTYSDNPQSYGDTDETTPDEATVYTFGLDIVKVDAAEYLRTGKAEGDAVLKGAEFAVVRPIKGEGGTITGWQIAKFTTVAGPITTPENLPTIFKEKGYYSIKTWDNIDLTDVTDKSKFDEKWLEKYTDTAESTEVYNITSLSGGVLNISGLDNDITYTIAETATSAADYAKINPFTITLTAAKDTKEEYTGKLSGAASDQDTDGSFSFDKPVDIREVKDADTDGSANMLVANFKYIDLPSTGGVGTIWFYIFGVAGIALSGVLFFLSKKKVTR